jgi:hypothetical protein
MVRAHVGLAIVAATRVAAAEPTSEVDPIHAQREDVQRLVEEHREAEPAPTPPPAPEPRKPPRPTADGTRQTVGILLLVAAGICVAVAVPAVLDSREPPYLAVGGAVVSGGIGLALVTSKSKQKTVTVSPAVASHAIGLAFTAWL